MTEYTHLVGAEDVRAAGRNMQGAAEQMQRAASHIDDALRRHEMFLDGWLLRLEAALERHTLGEVKS